MEKKIDYKAALENESLGMGIGSKVKAAPLKRQDEPMNNTMYSRK